MTRVYLSVGSNEGDRLDCLRRAVAALRAMPDVEFLDASPLYLTEPWERQPGDTGEQEGWFFNCAVCIDTELPPMDLLDRLQALESRMGRVRVAGTPEDQRSRARPLDIDILLYGAEVISTSERLHVPHLLMHERAFVLRPLADLAPEAEHPILYQTVAEILAGLEDEHQVHRSDLSSRWFL
jgi:2-amino-4-hydroxy-6-hydroxymethyldihydropteridine diphosphokinase